MSKTSNFLKVFSRIPAVLLEKYKINNQVKDMVLERNDQILLKHLTLFAWSSHITAKNFKYSMTNHTNSTMNFKFRSFLVTYTISYQREISPKEELGQRLRYI